MTLTETEQRTLRAAVDRIIPPDDFPGAWEAGVGDYIAGQLEGDLQHLQRMYREGLAALDTEAVVETGTAFAALTAEQQDAVLRRIEAGSVQTHWPVPPTRFFSLLIQHTAEGYYSDPGNGGNRDKVAWQMIGFQERYGETEASAR
jgi:gluconate 2-dehydrogenase gamma chain